MTRVIALALLLAASPALAQSRAFSIAGEAFSEADIVDARALPDVGGSATIMVTLSEAGSRRLAAATGKLVGKPGPIMLDGKVLAEPIVREPIAGGQFQWSGLGLTVAEADALALKISGKPPLPDSLED